VGHLLLAARDAGATRIVIGCGGSATTDGGWGAVQAVGSPARWPASSCVACDVTTPS
jgi:glycerate kinase